MKKLIFGALIVACFLQPSFLRAQENPSGDYADYAFELVPSTSNLAQVLEDKTLPQAVRDALKNSIVPVIVYRPNAFERRYRVVSKGTAFSAGDHKIVTDYHVVASGDGDTAYFIDKVYTKLRVLVNGDLFPTEVLLSSSKLDLVALRVFDLPDRKFVKKPLRLPQEWLTTASNVKGPTYAFGYRYGHLVLVYEFPRFLGYDTIFRDSVDHGSGDRVDRMTGILGRNVEFGTSGAPLLNSAGECVGVIRDGTDTFTGFIPEDEVKKFLKEVEKH